MLVAMPWRDEAQVIEWANDTHYGLAAFVFCKDIDRALRAAHRIEAGWVQVNRSGEQLPGMSYGGKKLSGLGSEYSIEGAVESFTQRKGITIGIGRAATPTSPCRGRPRLSANAFSRSRPEASPVRLRISNALPGGAGADRGHGRKRPGALRRHQRDDRRGGAAHDVELGAPEPRAPGEKVQPGLDHLEILEVLTTRAVAATMRARTRTYASRAPRSPTSPSTLA